MWAERLFRQGCLRRRLRQCFACVPFHDFTLRAGTHAHALHGRGVGLGWAWHARGPQTSSASPHLAADSYCLNSPEALWLPTCRTDTQFPYQTGNVFPCEKRVPRNERSKSCSCNQLIQLRVCSQQPQSIRPNTPDRSHRCTLRRERTACASLATHAVLSPGGPKMLFLASRAVP